MERRCLRVEPKGTAKSSYWGLPKASNRKKKGELQGQDLKETGY